MLSEVCFKIADEGPEYAFVHYGLRVEDVPEPLREQFRTAQAAYIEAFAHAEIFMHAAREYDPSIEEYI